MGGHIKRAERDQLEDGVVVARMTRLGLRVCDGFVWLKIDT